MSRSTHAPLFYGRHFPDDIISLAIRWYLRFSLSYRDLKEILAERGVSVDHSVVLQTGRSILMGYDRDHFVVTVPLDYAACVNNRWTNCAWPTASPRLHSLTCPFRSICIAS